MTNTRCPMHPLRTGSSCNPLNFAIATPGAALAPAAGLTPRYWRVSVNCTRSRASASAIFVAAFLSFASAGPLLAANTYYVDPGGDDGAGGTTDAPWRTLQRAANQVAAGDTVIVRAGTYSGFVLGWDFPQNGTPGNPITFHAEPGVVINVRNNKTPDGINLEGASYIVIEGFAVNGIDRAGIRSVQNNHVIIRNNQADQNGKWGIFTSFSDDVLIENNVTSRSRLEHGIYVSNSTVRPVVRGNLIWGNHAAAIHMNGDLSQGGIGLITDALVEDNVAYDNGTGGGSGINCDGVQSSRIVNNLLYNNHASGISLYQIDAAASAKNNLVAHNTIVQAADGRWALNIKDGSTGNVVYNNILYNHHPFRGSINIVADSLSGFVSNYNVVMERFSPDDGGSVIDLAAWRAATGQDLNSIVATPDALFVSEAGGDFHLLANAPAVDAGLTLPEVTRDIEGTPRPTGIASDIGAYEFATSAGGNQPPTAVASGSPTSGVAPLAVKFDATRSSDSDGRIVSYAWQFGDVSSTTVRPPVMLMRRQARSPLPSRSQTIKERPGRHR